MSRRRVRACAAQANIYRATVYSSLRKAMTGTGRRLLIAFPAYLGFKTYGLELHRVASTRSDLHAEYWGFHPTWRERALTRPLPGRTLRRIRDPIFTHRDHFMRWWKREGRDRRFDAVCVASQVNALALAELSDGPPFSVAVDLTRRNSRTAFGPASFTKASLVAEEQIFDRASLIAPMSRFVRDSLIHDYGVSADKILLVPPSIDVASVPVRRPSGNRRKRILFVGNDFVRKGGDALLKWHERFLRDEADLYIYSSTAPRTRRDGVYISRGISHDALVQEVMPTMDLMCLPTRRDMSPQVPVEAAACGLPVVISDVGGTTDLVAHGETGFIVSPWSADHFVGYLQRLLRDADELERMSAAARRHAFSNFNSPSTYGQLVDRTVAIG